MARAARDSDSPDELYSVVVHLNEKSTTESLKRKFSSLHDADIIVCSYFCGHRCTIPVPPTHRYVASFCYDEHYTVVLSKVRLTPDMLYCVFPQSLIDFAVDIAIDMEADDPPNAQMLVSSLEYSKPPEFSEPNETDTKRMHELVIGEKKHGVVLSENHEVKFRYNNKNDPYLFIFGSIYIPPEYATVNLVRTLQSFSFVFFHDDGDDAVKFHDCWNVPQQEHRSRLFELLEKYKKHTDVVSAQAVMV